MTTGPGPVVLVGGVGEIFQGDLDLGRLAIDRLLTEGLPDYVLLEELHYGGVAVAQRLEDVAPDLLILLGAARRQRPPGAVVRRRVTTLDLTTDEIQTAIQDAGTGYIDLELVVEVAWGLNALPERTVVIEVEPAVVGPHEGLSEVMQAALEGVVALVHSEVELAPLFEVAAQIRVRLDQGHLANAPATAAMTALLGELDLRDLESRWGRTFAERDRLRLAIAAGETGDGMEHEDWGLWWALIEELDRIAKRESDVT